MGRMQLYYLGIKLLTVYLLLVGFVKIILSHLQMNLQNHRDGGGIDYGSMERVNYDRRIVG